MLPCDLKVMSANA